MDFPGVTVDRRAEDMRRWADNRALNYAGLYFDHATVTLIDPPNSCCVCVHKSNPADCTLLVCSSRFVAF